MQAPKIKVCGMKHPENLQAVAALQPDYLGFIFYGKSPRYMAASLSPEEAKQLPASIKKVGVFVNETAEEIMKQAKDYQLQVVQLHGDESPDLCQQLQEQGLEVIKVFRIGEAFDMQALLPFENVVDYFLFDTAGKQYGGNGEAFNWQLLQNYPLQTPFFLSGGVTVASLDQLKELKHLPLYAIDVNSKFEEAPGIKNLALLQELFRHPVLYKNEQNI